MCDRHSRPRRSPRALARALAGAAMAVSMLIASGTVQAAEEPVRVAALVPFVEDAVGRMDAERIVVVASVRRSMTRPVAEGLVDLGNPHSPDLERLMMSGADLVVGDAIVHAAKKEELGRGGAEVVLIDTSSIDSALAGLVELASRAGAGDAMRSAVENAEADLASLELGEPIEVLTVFAVPGHAMLVTRRTWIGDLLDRLGFENAAGDITIEGRFGGYVEISDELVAELEPDWLLIVAHGAPDEVEKAFRRQLDEGGAWTSVAASTSGRIRVLTPRYFSSHPGLSTPEAARWLIDAVRETPAKSAAR